MANNMKKILEEKYKKILEDIEAIEGTPLKFEELAEYLFFRGIEEGIKISKDEFDQGISSINFNSLLYRINEEN